ncbi:hypothetical protein BU23DRAFT_652624 [Bimuria novae-zelandiae CBS 107.79]|uniref:Uncharacterized protein n=1 Tax=Bimuria novae-zelandiae CBS 107.79 TaxID=1447943 RepID=A0A6A5V021_9PLEO|nr:hypothetical protein BU23DRAFT_652624 [Bimuria novae-zelandiae CBS 107.79]
MAATPSTSQEVESCTGNEKYYIKAKIREAFKEVKINYSNRTDHSAEPDQAFLATLRLTDAKSFRGFYEDIFDAFVDHPGSSLKQAKKNINAYCTAVKEKSRSFLLNPIPREAWCDFYVAFNGYKTKKLLSVADFEQLFSTICKLLREDVELRYELEERPPNILDKAKAAGGNLDELTRNNFYAHETFDRFLMWCFWMMKFKLNQPRHGLCDASLLVLFDWYRCAPDIVKLSPNDLNGIIDDLIRYGDIEGDGNNGYDVYLESGAVYTRTQYYWKMRGTTIRQDAWGAIMQNLKHFDNHATKGTFMHYRLSDDQLTTGVSRLEKKIFEYARKNGSTSAAEYKNQKTETLNSIPTHTSGGISTWIDFTRSLTEVNGRFDIEERLFQVYNDLFASVVGMRYLDQWHINASDRNKFVQSVLEIIERTVRSNPGIRWEDETGTRLAALEHWNTAISSRSYADNELPLAALEFTFECQELSQKACPGLFPVSVHQNIVMVAQRESPITWPGLTTAHDSPRPLEAIPDTLRKAKCKSILQFLARIDKKWSVDTYKVYLFRHGDLDYISKCVEAIIMRRSNVQGRGYYSRCIRIELNKMKDIRDSHECTGLYERGRQCLVLRKGSSCSNAAPSSNAGPSNGPGPSNSAGLVTQQATSAVLSSSQVHPKSNAPAPNTDLPRESPAQEDKPVAPPTIEPAPQASVPEPSVQRQAPVFSWLWTKNKITLGKNKVVGLFCSTNQPREMPVEESCAPLQPRQEESQQYKLMYFFIGLFYMLYALLGCLISLLRALCARLDTFLTSLRPALCALPGYVDLCFKALFGFFGQLLST